MAKDSYSFKKKQKELATKKRQEQKMLNRLNKKNLQNQEDSGQTTTEPGPAV